MRRSLFVLAALLAVAGGRTTFGQPLMLQAPFGEGGTWNVYQVGNNEDGTTNHGFMRTDWLTATAESEALDFEGVQGAQVGIGSAEENRWVFEIVSRNNDGDTWIGLTDREFAAPLVTNNGEAAPQESNNLADKLTQGWAWTTGEPFAYQNWAANEPNDAGAGGEDVVHFNGTAMWNDHRSGWNVDEPDPPELQPGTSGDETNDPPNNLKFVTEFNTKSPTPFPGVRMPAALPPERLAGPKGQDGSVGVVEYHNLGTDNGFAYNSLYRVVDTIGRIQSAEINADATEGQMQFLDATDPDTSVNGGPNVPGPAIPHLTDVPGTDDDDIITVAHGAVRVTEPGDYTIQVRSDDGFGIRFPGKDWASASGGGWVDQFDSETMMFSPGTGDANAFGVINLPAGEHNLEFVWWERGGGAYYEVTTAKGAIEAGGNAQWLAMGDDSVLPDTTTGPVVNLTAPLFVGNLQNSVPEVEIARQDLWDFFDDLDPVSNTIEEFLIDDQNTAQACPFNENPQFHDPATVAQWPLNDPDVGGDGTNYDNFASLILGSFTVNDGDAVEDESLEISFHIDVDDRSILRIIDQSFDDVSDPGANPLGLIDVEGDMSMYSDWGTCNANYTGVITLTEGVEYDFEVTHVEQGGDSGIQIMAALGDHTVDFNGNEFFPLTTSTDSVFVPANVGMAFVAETEGLTGDYNNNGQLDAGDLDLQAVAMTGGQHPKEFDLNNDDLVNFDDRKVWVEGLKNTWIGDANLDLEFNSGDMVQVFSRGKYETGENAGWEDGDWNGDTVFGSGDMVAAFVGGGYEQGQKPAISAVPEPSSLVLVLIGLIGLVGLARRR